MQHAWIISIGTELTLGQSLDTNSAWLARELAALGVRAERHVTISDNLVATVEAVQQAAKAAQLVLITGGLGPTDDDLTREALAQAAGVELRFDAAMLEQIRAFFARRGREMPERNKSQAMVPASGRLLPNSCGTAPGVFVEICGTPVFAMPGVPFEMREMFNREIAPFVRAATTGGVLKSCTVRTYGLAESEVGERLRDMMVRGRNPEVGTTADLGEIGVRINVAAADAASADELMKREIEEVRNRLGIAVYGRDDQTLAAAVGELLAARNETVSTAESCTGGLIGTLLTDVAGSSRYFIGGEITYANEAKFRRLGVSETTLAEHGAVSAAIAEEMAVAARRAFSTSYALSVTGIAGPGGGTASKPVGLVYIGMATPRDVTSRELKLGEESPRGVIRQRAARAALNLLRLELCRHG